MSEVEYYPKIAGILEKEYGCRVYKYGKNHGDKGFYSVGHRKHFDLLVFHDKNNHIPNPLALEVKINSGNKGKLQDITTGLYEQVTGAYRDKRFCCPKEKWEGVPQYAFTTISAFEGRPIYEKHYPEAANFFIERFSWRMGVRILRKIGNKIFVTYNDTCNCLDGSWLSYDDFTCLWREEEKAFNKRCLP